MRKSRIWTSIRLSKANWFYLLGFTLLTAGHESYGQNQPLDLNHQFFLSQEYRIIQSNKAVHFASKPILQSFSEDSLLQTPSYLEFKRHEGSFLRRKLFKEHLISYDSNDVQLSIDYLVNLELADERAADPREINLYKNVRGFILRLNLGKKLSLFSSFREAQANLPLYLNFRTRRESVAFGQGRVKAFEDGFDYNMASSRIIYKPNKSLNIQIGQDKHFIGNGFRSFLLSDLAFNYPFLRVQKSWLQGKIQQESIYALLQEIERVNVNNQAEGLFSRKQAFFHFLSFNPTNQLSIGLFEGGVFQSLIPTGNVDVGFNYWLPLPMLNSIMEESDSLVNTYQGLNLNYRIAKQLSLYSQLSTQALKFNENSIQLGAKWFLSKSFTLQTEYNTRNQQSTYSIRSHYNESLTHPIEGAFEELLGGIYYSKGKWMTRLIGNLIQQDQGEITFLDINQAYVVNPAHNLTLNLGLQYRDASKHSIQATVQGESLYVYFGLSTNMQNLYFNY